MDLCTILVHINNYKLDINLYQIYVSGVLKCASIISQMFLCISPQVSLNFPPSFASYIYTISPFLSTSLVWSKVFHTSLFSHALTFH